jgi:DNA-nicking Smr family endonuclease
MSRRRIRPDELELWQQVAAKAERLHPQRPSFDIQFTIKAEAPNRTKPTEKAVPIAPFKVGQKAFSASGKPVQHLGLSVPYPTPPLQMDHKAFTQLKRGKLRPEARIDLHGMTLQQAHPELIGFILKTHADGCRLVLVITGKGKLGQGEDIIPRRTGVLRQKVPQWLRLAPVSSAILEVTPAHLKHGGSGAFYVYLRRRR